MDFKIGFAGALTIAFIVLKLTGVIYWSWLWVLSPLWFPFFLLFGVGLVIMLVVDLIKVIKGNEK